MYKFKNVYLMRVLLTIAFVLLQLVTNQAMAAFPDKPVTLVVGFAAGGLPDMMARSLAEASKEFLGQPIVISNRPGGTGSIAASLVTDAPRDGYTVGLIYGPTVSVMPQIVSETRYKGPDDFTPIMSMVQAPVYLIVKSNAPWTTPAQFLAAAKAKPGAIRAGTSGVGTMGAIMLDHLKQSQGIDITSVPFQGAAQGLTAVLGGHIEALIGNSGSVTGQLNAGTVRLLGVFEPKRVMGIPGMAEVPTFMEYGYPLIARSSGYFLATTKGVQDDIVQKLAAAFTKGMSTSAFQDFARANGLMIDINPSQKLGEVMRSDFEFMVKIFKRQ